MCKTSFWGQPVESGVGCGLLAVPWPKGWPDISLSVLRSLLLLVAMWEPQGTQSWLGSQCSRKSATHFLFLFGGFPSLFIGSGCFTSTRGCPQSLLSTLLLLLWLWCAEMSVLHTFRQPTPCLSLSHTPWEIIFKWPFGDYIQKKKKKERQKQRKNPPRCYAGVPEVLLELAATPGCPVHFEMCHFKSLQGLDLGSKWDLEQVKH